MRISLHGLNKEILILIYVALSLTSLFHCLSHLLMSACHCLFYFIILFSPVIALLSAVTMPVTFPAGLFFHLLEALYDAFVKRSIIQWHLMFLMYRNRIPCDGQGQNLQTFSLPAGSVVRVVFVRPDSSR